MNSNIYYFVLKVSIQDGTPLGKPFSGLFRSKALTHKNTSSRKVMLTPMESAQCSNDAAAYSISPLHSQFCE